MKIALVFFLLSSTFAGEISFYKESVLFKKNDLESLIQKFETRDLSINDPFQSTRLTFKVIKVKQLFHAIYGREWKNFNRIRFTCADGFQPEVPISFFLKYDSFLAYSYSTTKKPFRIFNRSENKSASLAPLYLIWASPKKNLSQLIPPSYWPYQIVAFDLISFKDPFLQLKPQNQNFTKGHELYQKYCLSCHQLKKNSLEILNSKLLVKENQNKLISYILNPRLSKPESEMPMLPLDAKDRKEMAQDIASFLFYLKEDLVKKSK